MEKTCFFFGHRESDERILPELETVIERLVVEDHVRYFYVGGYGGFDRIVTVALLNVKNHYPDAVLMRLLAYHPSEKSMALPLGFDGTYYPEGLETVPKRLKIVQANRIMIDQSDYVVCCVRHGASNSQKLLDYAQKRESTGILKIHNLET